MKQEGGDLEVQVEILPAVNASEKNLMLELSKFAASALRMLLKKKHRIRSVHIFMRYPMHSTAFTMRPRS